MSYESTKEKLNAFNFIKKQNKFTTMNTLTNKKFKMSVGKFASQFSEPFDAEHVSLRMCNGDKEKAKELQVQWKQKGQDSQIKGNTFHSMVEYAYDDSVDKVKQKFDLDMKLKKMFHAFYLKNQDRLKPLAIELPVGLPDGRIHGVADMLFYNTEIDKIYLFDWKTNEKMKREAYKDKKLLHHFSNFPDADFYKYSIQLGTYKYIIETVTGINIDDAFIGWFYEGNDEYKIYPIEDMSKQIAERMTCNISYFEIKVKDNFNCEDF